MRENPEFLLGQAQTASAGAPGLVIGTVDGFDELGYPLVTWPETPYADPIVALSTTEIRPDDLGRQVALLFADGDPERPVAIGMIRQPLDHIVDATEKRDRNGSASTVDSNQLDRPTPAEALVDGERVLIDGKKEIVLTCGKASITLTRAGKVVIRGEYVVSRSSGANRIKGGSIQLN